MKSHLKEVISKILDIDPELVEIEIPKDCKNGDYSSNICLKMAGKLKKNPNEIGQELIDKITDPKIEKIEVKSGFLNFYLKSTFLFDNLNKILKEEEDYGKNNLGNGKKINLEYVSANPTGTLHIGHARGAAYGDSMARILKYCGYDVTREYYINDGGNQINNLVESIKIRYQNINGEDIPLPEDAYHGKEIIEVAKNIYDKYGNKATDDIFRSYGLDYLLKEIKADLKNFRSEFDVWFSEKSLYDQGKIDEVLNKLTKLGYTYLEDGALFLKTSLFNDTKDRVLVKTDHTNTYLLPDIAYHMDKYGRNYDMLIDVFGADHHGYIPRLKASLEMLGLDSNKLSVKILQMVRLIKDGTEIKMSKRTGKSLTMNDLIKEVGTNAVRYFFAARSLDTQMDFDLDLATKKSNENPVYYVSYAHARICSILKDYDKEIDYDLNYKTIDSDIARNLLFKLYQFEDIVKLSSSNLEPHIITNYVYDLATMFHSFYAQEKILTDDETYTKERINLIKAIKIVIKNSLDLIGVEAPDKM